jgi:hypothetical protein
VTSPPTFFQGLWSFESFGVYLEKWLRPNFLGDLETIFAGSLMYWEEHGHKRNGCGHGDFALATLLFAWLDHLGSLLAKRGESRDTMPNIARCLRELGTGRLSSGQEVDHVIAHFARNALVHTSWPSTFVVLPQPNPPAPRRAFGLNVGADPDTSKHHLLYWRPYSAPGSVSPDDPKWVLKLRINVHVMLRQLQELLSRDLVTEHTEASFIEARKEAIAQTRTLEKGERQRIQDHGRRARVERQIADLFAIAPKEYPNEPFAVL